MQLRRVLPIGALAVISFACATPRPSGPSVMVLPGRNASFDRFADDDTQCRDWADHQVGGSPENAARETAAEGAVVGTAIGAAAGAAIGAASGRPATGAAVGAGSGLLAGSLYGGSAAGWSRSDVQRRYDGAYMQCMYGHGHQVPMARSAAPYSSSRSYDDGDGYDRYDRDVPPPPRVSPPPPPPDLR
jgi:hypothetical protein